ncbi:hypothetical protein Lser_V15G24181 [Lactuca serriola]
MKPLSSITIFLCSSSRRLFTHTTPLPFLNYEAEKLLGISHFSTSSPDSASSSYHSSSRRNPDDVRNVRVSVWWDFENCSVPCNVNVYKVTQCITAAVRSVGIKGPIQITAFGDVLQLSRSNQEALSSTGINLTHIPHGGKNSADRSLLVDLMYWVSQNPPPAHLFLISGDRDFASILHRLRMNNYNILLASTENAPAVLCSAASIMWQWPAMVKGENLSGKHFNQPPDGPYASWYGHYRVPLEDPFAVCNHVSNQTSSVQPEEEPRPVPKAVVNVIRNIMNSYPKGLSITELRAELGKSNVTIERDLYGHKKFSRFLMAMPHLLRLQFEKDGQYVIHGVTPKNRDTSVSTPDPSTAPNMTVKDSVPVTSVPHKEETLATSSKLQVPKVSTDSLPLPEKKQETQQVKEQSPVIEKPKEGEVSLGHQLYPVKMKSQTPEVGVLKSIWRKWFGSNDGYQDKMTPSDGVNECSTSRNSTDTVNADAKDQSSPSLSTNEVIQDAENKPHGILNQFVSWCKFWKSDKKSDNLEAELSKSDKEIPSHSEMQEIFTESFWNDILTFLETSKNSASVLQSKTRHEMGQKLQQFGPSQLQSLSEKDILHLVELLISEKKWVVETPSHTFPFKLVTPSKTTSPTKPSILKEFTESSDSQGQERQIKKRVSPKTRSQILSHCQKLVNEVVKEHPKGYKLSSFKKLFLEKYGYPLEVQQLGYQKLATLLQIMPGVKVESSYILPSGEHFRSENCKSEEEKDNDTKWEELGPISSTKKDDDFESVSDNDMSDSEEENSCQKVKREENSSSSLLQILDSWYSNKEENLNSDHLNNGKKGDGNDWAQKEKPVKQYSFVTDKPRNEKENKIDGILVNLKKLGNGAPESKIEG